MERHAIAHLHLHEALISGQALLSLQEKRLRLRFPESSTPLQIDFATTDKPPSPSLSQLYLVHVPASTITSNPNSRTHPHETYTALHASNGCRCDARSPELDSLLSLCDERFPLLHSVFPQPKGLLLLACCSHFFGYLVRQHLRLLPAPQGPRGRARESCQGFRWPLLLSASALIV